MCYDIFYVEFMLFTFFSSWSFWLGLSAILFFLSNLLLVSLISSIVFIFSFLLLSYYFLYSFSLGLISSIFPLGITWKLRSLLYNNVSSFLLNSFQIVLFASHKILYVVVLFSISINYFFISIWYFLFWCVSKL